MPKNLFKPDSRWFANFDAPEAAASLHASIFRLGIAALWCWVGAVIPLHAQQHVLDSLEHLAAQSTDTARIDALMQWGVRLRGTDKERSLEVLSIARDEAEKAGDLKRHLKAVNYLGVSYGMYEDFALALEQFKYGLRIHSEQRNPIGMADSYNNLGIVYRYIGDYPRSHDAYLEALRLFDSLDNPGGKAGCLHNIGVIYDLMEEEDKALDFFRQALQIQEAHKLEADRSLALHSIALIFEKKGKHEEALKYLHEHLQILGKLDDQVREATTLGTLGKVYTSLGDYEKAAHYLYRSKEQCLALGLQQPLANTLHHLAQMHLMQKRVQPAIPVIREQIRVAEETGSFLLRAQAYDQMAEACALTGDFECAFRHAQLAARYQDSLFNTEKTRAFQQWQARLEVYEKDRQLEQQQEELQWLGARDRTGIRLRWALLIAFVLAGFSAVLFYQKYRLRQQSNQALLLKNQLIETQKTEIEQMNFELEKRMLRAQINPHFIFNALSSIQHFITSGDRPAALKYLSKFSALLRQVLEDSIANQVVLAEEIQSLRTYLDLEALRFDEGFHYEITIDPAIDLYAVEAPVLLLQPFVENAVLHGLLPKKGERRLHISFAPGDGFTICSIRDNGIGRKAAAELKAKKTGAQVSRGLELTRKRLEALNKQGDSQTLIAINDLYHPDGSAAGTEVIIKIPNP